jgi:hypothetical protein
MTRGIPDGSGHKAQVFREEEPVVNLFDLLSAGAVRRPGSQEHPAGFGTKPPEPRAAEAAAAAERFQRRERLKPGRIPPQKIAERLTSHGRGSWLVG